MVRAIRGLIKIAERAETRETLARDKQFTFALGVLISLTTPEVTEEAPRARRKAKPVVIAAPGRAPDMCPRCRSTNVTKKSGCLSCLDCGDSKCG